MAKCFVSGTGNGMVKGSLIIAIGGSGKQEVALRGRPKMMLIWSGEFSGSNMIVSYSKSAMFTSIGTIYMDGEGGRGARVKITDTGFVITPDTTAGNINGKTLSYLALM